MTLTIRHAVAMAGLLCCSLSLAQGYPAKPITIIVPFAAGGPTDTVARLLAESMAKTLKQAVTVENVGGAGGTIGSAKAAAADAGGYTLLLHHIGHATASTLYRKLSYHPVDSFEPVGLVTEVPMTIIARKDFAPKNISEALAHLRSNKDKVTFANAGLGSASHLCGMLFMRAIDAELTVLPYKGTGPAMADMEAGQVDLMCDQTTTTVGHIKDGKVKAFAVTTTSRVPSLPNLPTLNESGLKGFNISVWHGLYAPKNTSKAVIDTLSSALRTALNDPTVKRRFAELGTEPVSEKRARPEALRAQLRSELDKWGPIITKAGAFAD